MVERIEPGHVLWEALRAHLARVDMESWVIDKAGRPVPDVYFLGVVDNEYVVGHISIKLQDIIIPATEWGGGIERPLTKDDRRLTETFVQTFAVDEAHRRRGHGRILQLAALDLTKEIGAYQMRSWSSLDKLGNYMLKLNLGFAAHPAIYETATGLRVSGVYFVKVV